MKTLKTLLLALFICSLSLACKKDKMPKPTQTGANTMYAKINGQPWEKKACWSCIGGGLEVGYDDRTLFVAVGQNKDQNINVSLIVKELKSVGLHELSNQSINYARIYNFNEETRYFTTNNNKGSVTITKLDLTNKIISGTFEFTAEDENNSANTVKVTDGWFDITYQ